MCCTIELAGAGLWPAPHVAYRPHVAESLLAIDKNLAVRLPVTLGLVSMLQIHHVRRSSRDNFPDFSIKTCIVTP